MPKRHGHSVFPWTSLPADIRLLIFEEITRQKYRGWSLCAAVCKEWQAIIEPKNFYQLALQVSCLEEFEYLVIRQRPLVQHICFNIELPQYTCPTCLRDNTVSHRNPTIFKNAIIRLFSILETWQPTGRLILELNTSSSSDSEHWFKEFDTRDWTQQEEIIRWHDPNHGWVDGQQVKAPDASRNVPKNIPVVHAVTGFRVRRQLRHELVLEVLVSLWQKLPRLESIVYELWRVRRRHAQYRYAFDLVRLFQEIPKHVKEVSIFKDFNDQLLLALNDGSTNSGEDMRLTVAIESALAKGFCTKSHILEHLSISYMIDAQLFFTTCQQLSCNWNLLQSLTLTSSTLARTAPHHNVHSLIRNASLTALNMPRLTSMVLWNGDRGQACAFIFQRHSIGMATLTWRGTWDLEINHDVIESWEKVVPDSCYLRFEKEVLRNVEMRSHGDAIYHLRLPDGLIDPESLRQIRQEGMMQRMA